MKRVGYLAAVALSGVLSVSAFAQNAGGGGGAPGGGGNNPGQGGGRGNNPGGQAGGGDRMAEWRERMATEMKEALGATDEEYKALQPKIEKVQTLQRQNMGGFGFGGGRRGGGGGGGGQPGGGNAPGGGQPGAQPGAQPGGQPAQTNPLQTASQDLRTVLDNKQASAADIKAKLDAVRAAKAKNREELTKAQTELKELLSQRQEAVLVQRGVLE
jgi:hypothetical protein